MKTNIDRLQTLAKTISAVDVLQSFATISERYQYVRPTLRSNTKNLAIVEGRHPVVEKVLGHQEYIPNSIRMNPETDILLITGPNMSEKYLHASIGFDGGHGANWLFCTSGKC